MSVDSADADAAWMPMLDSKYSQEFSSCMLSGTSGLPDPCDAWNVARWCILRDLSGADVDEVCQQTVMQMAS